MKEKEVYQIFNENSPTKAAMLLAYDFIKTNDEGIQHKEIVKYLTGYTDKNEERLLTVGNINGAFVQLNKRAAEYGIIKEKRDGGVFYKYIGKSENPDRSQSTIEAIEELLKKSFILADKLRQEVLGKEKKADAYELQILKQLNQMEEILLAKYIDQ